MSDIIEIKHLSKKFGEKQVINGININVRKQEIFGLLGPSGAKERFCKEYTLPVIAHLVTNEVLSTM